MCRTQVASTTTAQAACYGYKSFDGWQPGDEHSKHRFEERHEVALLHDVAGHDLQQPARRHSS